MSSARADILVVIVKTMTDNDQLSHILVQRHMLSMLVFDLRHWHAAVSKTFCINLFCSKINIAPFFFLSFIVIFEHVSFNFFQLNGKPPLSETKVGSVYNFFFNIYRVLEPFQLRKQKNGKQFRQIVATSV